MQCSKVFGYTLFSEYLINNAPPPIYKDNRRRARGVSDLESRRNYTILTSIQSPEDLQIVYSHSQTCYFKHSYLSLLANKTGESYKKCTLHHIGCKLTRFEHFLRDIEQSVFRHDCIPPKDSFPKEYDWLTEHLIQQFYNNALNFNEFLGVLLKLTNFSNANILTAQAVCWDVYYREYYSVLQKLALVNEHSAGFIEQLFAIFTQLDRHISCEISPFLMKQFIIWWIKESDTNPDKHFELIEQWYRSSDGQESTIDFIEFLDLLYKLFFKHFPITTRHFLLKDAYHSLVCKVLKKGYLAKCGPNNSKYQIRWMILYPDKLDYYKRKSEEEMSLKGTILLGEKAVVKNVYDDDKKGYYRFTVSYTSTARQFSIRADDIRIRMAWVTAIDQAIDVLKGNKGLHVFEKPLDLTRADKDLLASTMHPGAKMLDLTESESIQEIAICSVPLPAPYNGQIDPLLQPLSSFSGDDKSLPTSLDHNRDHSRTLHIRHIDREFPMDDFTNSIYESSSPGAVNSDKCTEFRSKRFPSMSSSEDEGTLPPLPGRQIQHTPLLLECIKNPIPVPRDLNKRASFGDVPSSNRVSMTTHSSFGTFNHFRVSSEEIPPQLAPRVKNVLPKVPPRTFPQVPDRVDSLRKYSS
ncbi:Differentially expressed in FDCP 6-like [Oopsacas minuta]|uniref:Differentially expressed in FDCP 6-like n=1 Tax=Oopsacas minuta TaxID=111878 RepID=A0AAV7K242_9METZ|nr:Differentially expressed in FDCP 6-like [Oopsacas minuta]